MCNRADSYILHRSLTNEYLASVGYDDILNRYKVLHSKVLVFSV